MKWIKGKIIPIVFCVSGGLALRFLSDNLEPSFNHILQDCLVFAFVVIALWKNKSMAVAMSFFTVVALASIELYAPQQWYNLSRAALILFLLVYLMFWAKCLDHKQKLQE